MPRKLRSYIRRKLSKGIGSRVPVDVQYQRQLDRQRRSGAQPTLPMAMHKEMRVEARRLGMTISEIVALAWKLARGRL
jgi:hypothetical protein